MALGPKLGKAIIAAVGLGETERDDREQIKEELQKMRLQLENAKRDFEMVCEMLKEANRAHQYCPQTGEKTTTLEGIADELLELVKDMHPDKNPRGLDATNVCARLNALRDKVRKGGN